MTTCIFVCEKLDVKRSSRSQNQPDQLLCNASYIILQFHGIATDQSPRPFPPPVFDRLQYANTDGEGLGDLVACSSSHYECYFKQLCYVSCNVHMITLKHQSF